MLSSASVRRLILSFHISNTSHITATSLYSSVTYPSFHLLNGAFSCNLIQVVSCLRILIDSSTLHRIHFLPSHNCFFLSSEFPSSVSCPSWHNFPFGILAIGILCNFLLNLLKPALPKARLRITPNLLSPPPLTRRGKLFLPEVPVFSTPDANSSLMVRVRSRKQAAPRWFLHLSKVVRAS